MWVSENRLDAGPLPFTRAAAVAVAPDRLYLGTQDSYEIRAFDRSGSLRSIIRLDQEPRPVTSSGWAAYVEDQIEDIDDPGQMAERRSSLEEMRIHETMPAYGYLTADPLGHLWVSEYRGPDEGTLAYTVFDAEGELVGRLPIDSNGE